MGTAVGGGVLQVCVPSQQWCMGITVGEWWCGRVAGGGDEKEASCSCVCVCVKDVTFVARELDGQNRERGPALDLSGGEAESSGPAARAESPA